MTSPKSVQARGTVLVDLDGTLVDSNYHHVLAWARAFREQGLVVPLWRIHRAIGMGGDQLVGALVGAAAEARAGDELREGHARHYRPLMDEVVPLGGAREFLLALKACERTVILTSSAGEEEVESCLEKLDASSLVDGWTTGSDVAATKPAPDLAAVALEKASTRAADAVMVGDSVWDVAAAGRAGLPTLCLLTGGYSADELVDAGAAGVYEALPALWGPLGL